MGFVTTPLATGARHSKFTSDFVCRSSSQPQSSRKQRATINMGLFGLGFPEIAVIAGVGIFIFGPSKVAEMGKDLGGLAGGVKKATSEFRDAMQESLDEADRDIENKKLEKEVETPDTSTTTVASEPVERRVVKDSNETPTS